MKKPSHSSKRNRKASLPQDSFRRRVRIVNRSPAGLLAFGSSSHPQPSRSAIEQWLAPAPERMRLADHSGGTAADLHGLPLTRLADGTPQEQYCQKPKPNEPSIRARGLSTN